MSTQSHAVSRREFLGSAATAAAGTILVACTPTPTPVPTAKPTAASATTAVPATKAPQATQPPAATQPAAVTPAPAKPGAKTVTFWTPWGANVQKGLETVAAGADLKQALPDTTLDMKFAITAEAMLTALAAGTPPDCAANVDYLGLMARGVTLPLDDLVAKSSVIKKELYVPAAWNSGFYKGKMMALPAFQGGAAYSLLYNSRLVTEAGLDPAKPPLTWDECMAWHKKLTKFDSAGNLVSIGFDPYDAMGGSLSFANGFYPSVSWGFKWYDADTGKLDLANDKMAESLDVMGEFIKFMGPDKYAGFRQVKDQGGWGGAYRASKQAVIINGNWFPGVLINGKFDCAQYTTTTWPPVPASRSGVRAQGLSCHFLVLLKGGKNLDGAFKFGEVLTMKSSLETLWKTVGWTPSIPSFANTLDPNTYPGFAFFIKSLTEASEMWAPAPCPVTAFAETTWIQLREQVYRGQKTSKQAAQELQTLCEAELKKLKL